MGKKRKNRMQKPEIEGQSEYYRLKTQAVDDLVNASEESLRRVEKITGKEGLELTRERPR